jgi:hypothetical protein
MAANNIDFFTEKVPKIHCIGGWFEPQNHCVYETKERNYCPCSRTSVVQPIADCYTWKYRQKPYVGSSEVKKFVLWQLSI